ncbi:glycosyl transferase [Pseudovibrio japonicus]|uniref:Glycosyl transferase n=1 Tax=Pseudovibrio japonicus TaxID=366534 RepID=A0ABQ3E3I1_9HYPH|nr:glycosyltransferase [Pseudovibrio japonicus]GHB24536.1 glycosyl transferase [Pseudovibrio japonicus]
MAKIAIVATDSWYVWNFRADTIRRLVSDGYAVTVYSGNRDYLDHLSALGTQVEYLPLDGRRVRPLRELGVLLRFIWRLKRDSPDIVLSFNPKANLYTGLARHLVRFGWIANISGLGVLGEISGFWSLLVLRIFRIAFIHVNHCIFQNEADLEAWKDAKIVPADLSSRQFGTGVNLSEFACVQPPEGALKVICIARLLEKKGIGEYIELAKSVRSKAPRIDFLLAGNHVPVSHGGFPAEKIAAAEAAGHIQYLGMLEDVQPLLSGRTVGCLLTRYKEGIPRSMIEFLATGRPILISSFDAATDLVPDQSNGHIVAVQESNWLETASDYIMDLEENPEQYQILCCNARAMAETRFDGNVGIEEYLKQIKNLL